MTVMRHPVRALPLALAVLSTVPWSTAAGQDCFGGGLAVLGDVNGDGIDDFAVSNPWRKDPEKGAGWIASVSGKTRSPLWEVWGEPEAKPIGEDLFEVGDVDGDGVSDLAQWSWWDSPMTVLSGASGEELLSFPGRSAAPAGDVDGDGHGDVLVAGQIDVPDGEDAVTLAFIRSGGNGEVLGGLTAPAPLTRVTWAVATGDVDDDGLPDWAVRTGGRPLLFFRSRDGHPLPGEVGTRLLSVGFPRSPATGPRVTARVQDGSLMLVFTEKRHAESREDPPKPTAVELREPSDMAMPGHLIIDCLGDVDDDGVDDFLVGLNSGEVAWELDRGLGVWSGATARRVWNYPEPEEPCLTRMMSIHDLDEDGVMDVLISGFWAPGAREIEGWVEARSGRTGEVLFRIHQGDFR